MKHTSRRIELSGGQECLIKSAVDILNFKDTASLDKQDTGKTNKLLRVIKERRLKNTSQVYASISELFNDDKASEAFDDSLSCEAFDILEQQRQWAVMKQIFRNQKQTISELTLKQGALEAQFNQRSELLKYISTILQTDSMQFMLRSKGDEYQDNFLSLVDWNTMKEFLRLEGSSLLASAIDARAKCLKKLQIECRDKIKSLEQRHEAILSQKMTELNKKQEIERRLLSRIEYLENNEGPIDNQEFLQESKPIKERDQHDSLQEENTSLKKSLSLTSQTIKDLESQLSVFQEEVEIGEAERLRIQQHRDHLVQTHRQDIAKAKQHYEDEVQKKLTTQTEEHTYDVELLKQNLRTEKQHRESLQAQLMETSKVNSDLTNSLNDLQKLLSSQNNDADVENFQQMEVAAAALPLLGNQKQQIVQQLKNDESCGPRISKAKYDSELERIEVEQRNFLTEISAVRQVSNSPSELILISALSLLTRSLSAEISVSSTYSSLSNKMQISLNSLSESSSSQPPPVVTQLDSPDLVQPNLKRRASRRPQQKGKGKEEDRRNKSTQTTKKLQETNNKDVETLASDLVNLKVKELEAKLQEKEAKEKLQHAQWAGSLLEKKSLIATLENELSAQSGILQQLQQETGSSQQRELSLVETIQSLQHRIYTDTTDKLVQTTPLQSHDTYTQTWNVCSSQQSISVQTDSYDDKQQPTTSLLPSDFSTIAESKLVKSYSVPTRMGAARAFNQQQQGASMLLGVWPGDFNDVLRELPVTTNTIDNNIKGTESEIGIQVNKEGSFSMYTRPIQVPHHVTESMSEKSESVDEELKLDLQDNVVVVDDDSRFDEIKKETKTVTETTRSTSPPKKHVPNRLHLVERNSVIAHDYSHYASRFNKTTKDPQSNCITEPRPVGAMNKVPFLIDVGGPPQINLGALPYKITGIPVINSSDITTKDNVIPREKKRPPPDPRKRQRITAVKSILITAGACVDDVPEPVAPMASLKVRSVIQQRPTSAPAARRKAAPLPAGVTPQFSVCSASQPRKFPKHRPHSAHVIRSVSPPVSRVAATDSNKKFVKGIHIVHTPGDGVQKEVIAL